MNADQLRSIIDAGDKAALVRRLEADLDRFSPLIGADGPPDQPGPQEPYVRALQQSADDSVATALTEAIQVPLLAEASHLAESGQVRRPLLLYNLFSLLEAVRLPGVIDSLRVLRKFEKPLAAALVGNHDDLYAQLLIAHAVNQRGAPEDLRFWLGLLDHECIDYVSAGVVGLRESGHFNALCHLTKIKEAHRQHPELGSFDDEIMLLLDTYPDVNWSVLVGEHVEDKETIDLIRSQDRIRYQPNVEELTGPAAETIRRAGKAAEVQKAHQNWLVPPALALVGNANGASRIATAN
jgi:hypothetical protein